MRNGSRWFLVATCLVLGFSGAAVAGDVNVWFGQKSLEENDWAPVEDQTQFGVMMNFGNIDWPVSIAVDIFQSSDDAAVDYGYGYGYYGYYVLVDKVEGKTTEIDVGTRWIWDNHDTLKPYAGVGLAWVSGEFEVTGEIIDKQSFGSFSESVDDSAVGLWVNGGFMWRATGSFNLGLDLRYSSADVEILGFDVDAGGLHYGVFAGYHW